jgi:hypothetical protein
MMTSQNCAKYRLRQAGIFAQYRASVHIGNQKSIEIEEPKNRRDGSNVKRYRVCEQPRESACDHITDENASLYCGNAPDISSFKSRILSSKLQTSGASLIGLAPLSGTLGFRVDFHHDVRLLLHIVQILLGPSFNQFWRGIAVANTSTSFGEPSREQSPRLLAESSIGDRSTCKTLTYVHVAYFGRKSRISFDLPCFRRVVMFIFPFSRDHRPISVQFFWVFILEDGFFIMFFRFRSICVRPCPLLSRVVALFLR